MYKSRFTGFTIARNDTFGMKPAGLSLSRLIAIRCSNVIIKPKHLRKNSVDNTLIITVMS